MMKIVNPGPWVNSEIIETDPWLTQQGPIKFIEFPVRSRQMSRRAFQLYWQKHHSPHVMNLTTFAQFIRKYNSGHIYPEAVFGLPEYYHQDMLFEGASELWLDSLDEIGSWFEQPVYEELIHPDELRFLSQEGDGKFLLAKEEPLYVPDLDMVESNKTKVYLLIKRQIGQSYDDFHRAASNHGKLILEQKSLTRYIDKLVVSHKFREPYPEGFELNDIEAVVELWFSDIEKLQLFFSESVFLEKITRSEKENFDHAEIGALVAKMRVVHDEYSFQPSTTQPLPFCW